MDNGLTDADEAFEGVRDDLIGEFLADIEGGHLHRPTHSSITDYLIDGHEMSRAMTVGEMIDEITDGGESHKLRIEMFALVGALAAGPTGTDHHIRAKAVLAALGQAYGRIIEDYAAEVTS